MIERKKTREVKIGKIKIGGNNPVAVQSMTCTKTADVKATVKQILELEDAECEIVRCTANNLEAAKALGEIKKEINIPLVADIHFDYLCALEAAKHVDKIRINPGNIGSKEKTLAVINACKDRGIPIRIGVNAGSIEPKLLQKYGHPTAEAMVESALGHVKILEEEDFTDIVISLKASDVPRTVKAYELMSKERNYPLHLGITEAGTSWAGAIKSGVGIGILLNEGIGDTIRVSLTTNDLVEEVKAGYEILKALKLRDVGREFTSCPTCGRTEIDLVGLAKRIEKATENIKEPIHIAVMGCVVNGPGEAREADIGIAGGKNAGVIFRKGKVVKTCKESELFDEFMKELRKLLEGQRTEKK